MRPEWRISASPPPPASHPPPDLLVQVAIETHQTTILVRVVESTFPGTTVLPALTSAREYRVLGKVLVLKSWWGPFPAGVVLHVAEAAECAGTIEGCTSYPLRVGDELLIVTQGTQDPIVAALSRTWPAAESQAAMAAFDRAVKK